MSDSLKYNIFNETECISEQTLFDYIDKKLNAKESHAVEKHLLHCELCSDALEGLQLVKNRGRVHTINEKIKERIASPESETKMVTFNYKTILSVAATVLLLVGGIFFFNLFNDKKEMAVFNQEQTTPEPPAPPPAPIERSDSESSAEVHLEKENNNKSEQVLPLPKSTSNYIEESFSMEQENVIEIDREAAGASVDAISSGSGSIYRGMDVVESSNENKKDIVSSKALNDPAETPKQQMEEAPQEEAKKTERVILISEDKASIPSSPSKRSQPELTSAGSKADRDVEDEITVKASKKSEQSSRHEAKEKRKNAEKENTIIAYAPQSAVSEQEADDSFQTVSLAGNIEQDPVYPGGQDSLISFIQKHLNHSVVYKNQQPIDQTLQVEFTIDKDGYLKNPKILRGINAEIDTEVLKVLNTTTKWTPGKNSNGKQVSKKMVLPIHIN